MVDKFTAIKFYKKEISFFTSLNLTIKFHQAIKKIASNNIVVQQKYMTKENRIDYLKLLVENDPIDFLEFGVFQGSSIFGVFQGSSIFGASKHNLNPKSRFFGFDTFDDGYPEGFDNHPKGDYSTSVPHTNDSRISFVKGKFQDSLDDFLKSFTPKSRLVIHFDADLYSATLFVLTRLDSLFDDTTILSFDEFGGLTREFQAFYDYSRSYYRDYEIIQHTPKFHRVSLKLKI